MSANGPASTPLTARWPALFSLAAAAVMFLTGLAALDLWAPDEPRYAAIAEEMRSFRHGLEGLVLLHLNDEVYDQKPPLYFWTAALAGAPAGRVGELAARLPSALCGIGVVWLLIGFGERRLGRHRGAVAGLLLLSSFEFVHRARRVQLDVMLVLFEWLAVVCFWRLQAGPPRTRDIALLHAALGAALLTKGPVGLLLPLSCFATFLAYERRWSLLRVVFRPWAFALSLGPALLWFAGALALGPDGFLHGALVDNVFGRFFSGTSHVRPAWYYLLQFPVGFLPWSLLLPLVVGVGLREVRPADAEPERRRVWSFLISWIALQFLFFSVSEGKRSLYLLPVYPAAALLCADAVVTWLSRRRSLPRWLSVCVALGATAIAGGSLAAWLIGEIAAVAVPGAAVACLVALAALTLFAGHVAARSAKPAWAGAAVIAGYVLALEFTLFVGVLPALDAEKSPRPIARAAAELTPPGEPIGVAFKRTLIGGIGYYGDRPVTLLDDPDSIAAFVRDGGRAIVVLERRFDELGDAWRFDIRARFRSGSRAVLVVSPVGASDRDPRSALQSRESSSRASSAEATVSGAVSGAG